MQSVANDKRQTETCQHFFMLSSPPPSSLFIPPSPTTLVKPIKCPETLCCTGLHIVCSTRSVYLFVFCVCLFICNKYVWSVQAGGGSGSRWRGKGDEPVINFTTCLRLFLRLIRLHNCPVIMQRATWREGAPLVCGLPSLWGV